MPDGLTNVIQVEASSDHSLALRSDGSVIVWGWNPHGQLDVPRDLGTVSEVAAGEFYSVALCVDDRMVI